MNPTRLALVAALLAAPALLSTPSQAKTAYQLWAQGRGADVSSKDRLTTWQDDLAGYGLLPPPRPYYGRGYAPRRAYHPEYYDGDEGY